MLKQANDFYQESIHLYKVLEKISESELQTSTLFKKWTLNDIIRHLHVWNVAINLSLLDSLKWKQLKNNLEDFLKKGKTLRQFEKEQSKNLKGKELLLIWKDFCITTKENFKHRNPKERMKWIGPDMSIISAVSSRHMETWAHGQSIYDKLGIVRKNDDSILNIVIMGNNTFKWSFKINNLEIPEKKPYLQLKAPSGKFWYFNEPDNKNKIEGYAEDFCKVVTQVRNILDVNLKVTGKISKKWMRIAQCFAGKAETPPKAGTRKIKI